jgi:BirA family biotin operon repressor/biotin-[acetyl-CoA-carboxylase] ligase
MPTDLFHVQHHALLGSTNDEAKRLAQEGCAHGTVIWADEQTAGHGRLGRPWISPRGNLLVSVVLRPTAQPGHAAELGFLTAVVVAEAVALLLPQPNGVGLKWPNDVQVNGAKIAGVLPEARSDGGTLRWVVLGVGLNLANAPGDMPYPVTCLRDHGVTVTPEQGLERFLERLALWLVRWEADGFMPVRAAWLTYVRGLGREVTVRIGDREERGVFRELADDGAMVLATDKGLRRITAGEISFGQT